MQNQIKGGTIIQHVNPIPDVHAVPVKRQRLILNGVRNEQRNNLFRILIRTEIIRAAGDDGRESVGPDIRLNQQIPRGLGRRIGAVRTQRRVLRERAVLNAPVHLVRADLDIPFVVIPSRGLQKHIGPVDIRLNKTARLQDRTIHMRLGCEIDDDVDLPGQGLHRGRITNVAPHEAVVRMAFDIPQVVGIPGIGKLVQIDDRIIRMLPDHLPDEVAADETGATGDE